VLVVLYVVLCTPSDGVHAVVVLVVVLVALVRRHVVCGVGVCTYSPPLPVHPTARDTIYGISHLLQDTHHP
jgi:hypothetical protein